ncbi:MAG TPA: integrase [Mycobacterium sp.]|nr:integrase [Mycobacterium sp.]
MNALFGSKVVIRLLTGAAVVAAVMIISVASVACTNAPLSSERGDQASAEKAIRDGYVKKLANCDATRGAVADVQSISWDPPGFSADKGGPGTIRDADPDLGGHFIASYVDDHWDIQYEWC